MSIEIRGNRQVLTALSAVTLVLLAVLWHQIGELFETRHRNALHSKADASVQDLIRATFRSDLTTTAQLMGRTNRRIRQTVTGETGPDNLEILALLTALQKQTQASIVYVMNKDGLVVGSTRYDGDDTLTGNIYKFRPYFTEAMKGRNMIFPAIGVTTNERGLYYSSPIMSSEREEEGITPIGVITFKISLQNIDGILKSIPQPAALTSPEGLVFSTNQPEWLFTSFQEQTSDNLQSLIANRQFGSLYTKERNPKISILPSGRDTLLYRQRNHAVISLSVNLDKESIPWKLVLLEDMTGWYPVNTALALSAGILSFSLIAGLYLNTSFRRKQMEQENLRVQHLANETYHSIFNAADDAILVHRVDTGEVVDCNSSALFNWGYSREEMLSMPLAQLFAEEAEGNEAQGSQWLDGEKSAMQNVEWLAQRKNGETFLLDVNLRHCTINGEPRKLCVCRDISAKRQLERDLIRSERLAAVGTLASGVAHEFNNINCIIKGFADLLIETETLSADAICYIRRIQKSSTRAAQITGSLLSLTGKHKNSSSPTNPVEIIEDTLALVGRELEKEGIRLKTFLEPVPYTECDSCELGQVMLNMIINARHAMVGIPFPCLTLTTTVINQEIRIDINDNGCGISEENLKKVFMPFFSTKGEHGPGTRQASLKGTGLGLSVSYSIISAYGGRIEVTSKPGKGTSFTIILPVYQVPAIEQGGVSPLECTPIALILDTDTDTRSLIKAVLDPSGFLVNPVRTLNESLPLLEEQTIHLAFIDHAAIVSLSSEKKERLRKIRQRNVLYIVEILTQEEQQKAPDASSLPLANHTIIKPFSLHEIKEVARKAMAPHHR